MVAGLPYPYTIVDTVMVRTHESEEIRKKMAMEREDDVIYKLESLTRQDETIRRNKRRQTIRFNRLKPVEIDE